MSKNPNVEKAVPIIHKTQFPTADDLRKTCRECAVSAEALDAAGLLVTPLHQRALEACREYAVLAMPDTVYVPERTHRVLSTVLAVGREALALEKPKERWIAHRPAFSEWWYVGKEGADPMSEMPLAGFTETQAKAVAKALNEVAE